HRDIKPQNIILLKDGTIKVTDFGIARFSRSEQRTITDKAIGSVHYISPEQARGDATDGKSDIYSVGVMLYEMTTGKLPFQADSAVSVAIMQLQNEPEKPTEFNSSIPKGLEQIILLAMQKESAERYPTAFDMLKDIEEIRRNPYVQFDHNYRITHQGGMNINPKSDMEYTASDYQDSDIDAPKKSNTVKVLAIVAALFVIAMGGLVFYFLNDSSDKTFVCPNFVGKTLEEIQSDSKYDGYQFSVEYGKQEDYKNNQVYNQKPSAGTKMKSTSKIVLIVNKIDPIKLSDYKKMSYEEAKSALEELGLKVKKVTKNDDDIAENCVIKSSPSANQTVNKGDTVTLYVSLGPERYQDTVPDVTGLYYQDAISTLRGKGFEVDYENNWIYDNSFTYGYVISQSPTGNTNASSGDTVKIYISKGAYYTKAKTTIAPQTEAEPEKTEEVESAEE
ncbi:MAG: PASTA domain-containing protein, partial [Clostridia bacterium]|nr:PASTA domain-containing protein [Clostridia bacterium]